MNMTEKVDWKRFQTQIKAAIVQVSVPKEQGKNNFHAVAYWY
jgi:hypothetical protein